PSILRGTDPNTPIAAAPAPFPTPAIGQVMAAIGVNANTSNPDGAKAFVEWFLSPEAQSELQGFLGGSMVATAVERTPAELEESPFISVFDQQSDNALSFIPPGLETRTPKIRSEVV